MIQEAILALAMTFPPPWYPPGEQPENAASYRHRLETIATAIALEAPSAAKQWDADASALAVATLVVWYRESRFARAVHLGLSTARWSQDEGRARCLGQLHQTGLVPASEWRSLTGADVAATRRCARATMRVLTAHANGCAVSPSPTTWQMARVFSAYGTGRGCKVFSFARKRARMWFDSMSRFQEVAAGLPPTERERGPDAREEHKPSHSRD